MQKIDGKFANAIRTQLKQEGTFSKTNIVEVDTFLEFIRKDISYVRKYLGDNFQNYVDELAEIAYGFVLVTIPDGKKVYRTYRAVDLKELACLERKIYGAATSRDGLCSFVPVIKPDDFVRRLEILGMKEGTVLMNPYLQSAYDLFTRIYMNPFSEAEWLMADIIYSAQEYAYTVFHSIKLVGAEEFLDVAGMELNLNLMRIQRLVDYNTKRRDKDIKSMTKI